MYNLWWLVIGFGVATIILVVLAVVLETKCSFLSFLWRLGLTSGFALITGVSFIVLLSIAIINPICVRNEYNEFLETKVLVEQICQGDYKRYENAGLNSKVIELNQWLICAKAQKKQWGNWSMYCGVDVENLDYIVLNYQN